MRMHVRRPRQVVVHGVQSLLERQWLHACTAPTVKVLSLRVDAPLEIRRERGSPM